MTNGTCWSFIRPIIINSNNDKAFRADTEKGIDSWICPMGCLASNVPLLLKKNTLVDYKNRHIKDITLHDSSFDLDTFQRHHHIIVCLCKKIMQSCLIEICCYSTQCRQCHLLSLFFFPQNVFTALYWFLLAFSSL